MKKSYKIKMILLINSVLLCLIENILSAVSCKCYNN